MAGRPCRIKRGNLLKGHGAAHDVTAQNLWGGVAHSVYTGDGSPLLGRQAGQARIRRIEMPLASDGVAEIIGSQDRQNISDHVRHRLGEDLESDRVVKSAGGLQIELRSPAGQHCLTA